MKKINKRSVFSVVLCAMLVFCAGFYSSAEPTTAWFSDAGESSNDYAMEELNIAFTGDGFGENATKLELSFDAATKFADADERAGMFEHAAKYYVFTAESSADNKFDAQIKIDVNYENTQDDIMTAAEVDKGLRYFVYEVDAAADAVAQAEEYVPDVWVDADGKCLVRGIEAEPDVYYDSKLADKLEDKIQAESGFDTFTEEQKLEFLRSVQETPDPIAPGEKKTYCICFWVEYDAFISQTETQSPLRNLEFDVDVKVSAEQYVEAEDSAAE